MPNFNKSTVKVLVSKRQGRNTIKIVEDRELNDVTEEVISNVMSYLLETIDEIHEFDRDDGENIVCDHALPKFIHKYMNTVGTDDEDKPTKRFFLSEFKKLVIDYKDDIKKVWTKQGLL